MDPKSELAKQFLMRSDDDLRVSELILKDSDPVFWGAAFHAQQCTEKALKSLLTYHDIRAGKTHDIADLLKLSLPVLPNLKKFKDRASTLTAYAVDFRYPVQYRDVTQKEALEAMEVARSIFETVLNALPDFSQE